MVKALGLSRGAEGSEANHHSAWHVPGSEMGLRRAERGAYHKNLRAWSVCWRKEAGCVQKRQEPQNPMIYFLTQKEGDLIYPGTQNSRDTLGLGHSWIYFCVSSVWKKSTLKTYEETCKFPFLKGRQMYFTGSGLSLALNSLLLFWWLSNFQRGTECSKEGMSHWKSSPKELETTGR